MTSSKISERLALLARIAPQSVSAASVTSTYVSPATMGLFGKLIALAHTGQNSTGDVTVSLIKASDASGTNAEAFRSAAAMSSDDADDKDVVLHFDVAETDPAKPYVALRITVSDAACLVAGSVLGGDARFEPADRHHASSVAQVVG